ncbi:MULTISPECIES: FtsH protease activity modulator HflK [Pseudovibrio]|uniref:FtsH protease activity modulator HflK n=1 Tax=Stappiaceae TaxID=2821832 RepID=UPI002365EF3D|nr:MULTISPECIES: FtsH protease activity modulator HflK [Pseudovibrio]MDD7910350.1 FtsH protease activity modulator HflK [Pseudovibrio exalbescens]MDX5594065.1 FtsH protease activity modulator HflK [Pseudovibrio sp. SPO723]
MPWSNQTGGGWKGGGNNGGPWGNSGGGGGGGGPWGGGPQRGGGGGGGNPPDFEEILKRGQDHLKNVLPGNGGGMGFKGILLAIIAALVIWLATGIYRVNTGEVGVELVFGQVVGQTAPGLNYNWPYPVGEVYKPDVLRVRETTVGMEELVRGTTISNRDVAEESLMLTGDENIVDVDFKIQWVIQNTPTGVSDFLFNIQDPEATVKAVAESAMREVVGSSRIDSILTENRAPIQQGVQDLMQATLDNYGAGIQVRDVQMQKVDPPAQVIEAFRDVQAARADQERIQNEAQAYANRIVPEARGEAARITEAAQAYRDQTIAQAEGQAQRFTKVYEEYTKAPDVTRQRLYLETMEEVLSKNQKIIIDGEGSSSGVLPYLPLDQLNRRTGATGGNN